MKLKNILLIVSAAGMLFSCTKDIIDNNPPVPEDGEVVLSLAVSPEDVVVSRADSYTGEDGKVYYPATDAEKTIDHCLLVVFDSEDKVYSWYKYGQEEGETALGTPDENFVYTLTGVKAKAGETRFLVIANETTDYSSLLVKGTPYSDFADADIIETDAEATFTPSSLVKAGQLEKEISATDKTVAIPLTQLAARVDVTFEFAPKEGLSEITTEVSAEALNGLYYDSNFIDQHAPGQEDQLSFELTAPDGTKIPVSGTYQNAPNRFDEDDYYYFRLRNNGTYTRTELDVSRPKIMAMDKIYYKVVTETSGWTVGISNVAIYNIETKSSVILSYDDKLNTKKELIDKEDIEVTREPGTDSYSFSFYTYEKQYVTDGNLNEVLHITFNAEWEEGEKITEQLAERSLEAGMFYLCGADRDGEPVNGNNGRYLVPIYHDDLNVDFPAENIGELTLIGNEVETKNETINEIYSTYRIKINPVADPNSTADDGTPKKFTNGLIHGNIYMVSGKITEMPSIPVQDVVFEYAVVPWNTKAINIPTFE
ncbi:MAG: hypothetical protein LBV32_05105 [Tannerellaceae bacterium]|jgi:hypothetical protein|nr:hypothetical protein [Tannerellaceae bacterium]